MFFLVLTDTYKYPFPSQFVERNACGRILHLLQGNTVDSSRGTACTAEYPELADNARNRQAL